jgi:hypothetical protein
MIKKIATCLFMLFILFSCFVHACFAIGQPDAEEMLIKAENDLSSAYDSVAEADFAGANISDLLNKLGLAGDLLADANNSYRVGNYEKAYLFAMNCSDTVHNIVYEASTLKSDAEKAYSQKLMFNVWVSSIGLSVLFVLSLFGWRFLKKKFLKQVLEMKPQVEGGAK